MRPKAHKLAFGTFMSAPRIFNLALGTFMLALKIFMLALKIFMLALGKLVGFWDFQVSSLALQVRSWDKL